MFMLSYDLREPIWQTPPYGRKWVPFALLAFLIAGVAFLLGVTYFAAIDSHELVIEEWKENRPESFSPLGTIIVNGTVELEDGYGNPWTFYFHQNIRFDSIASCTELLRVGFQSLGVIIDGRQVPIVRFAKSPYAHQVGNKVINSFDGFTAVLNAVAFAGECVITTECLCDTNEDRIFDSTCPTADYLNYLGFFSNTFFYSEELFAEDKSFCEKSISDKLVIRKARRDALEIFSLAIGIAEVAFGIAGLVMAKLLYFGAKNEKRGNRPNDVELATQPGQLPLEQQIRPAPPQPQQSPPNQPLQPQSYPSTSPQPMQNAPLQSHTLQPYVQPIPGPQVQIMPFQPNSPYPHIQTQY